MIIKNRVGKGGFSINLLKGARVEYPRTIWGTLHKRDHQIIADNLTYLKVSPYSMFLSERMDFHFPHPHLKDLGDEGVKRDIPRVAEEDGISTHKLLERFEKREIGFNGKGGSVLEHEQGNNVVIGTTFGKDSLLSYGIARELGLATNLVFVQDCWDTETEIKLELIKRFEKEFGEKIEIMTDEIDDISCQRRVNKTGSEGIVGCNAMNGYMVMLLPFALRGSAGSIIFGNEQNFNDFYQNKEGFRVYPSYEQSGEWMVRQNAALRGFTNGIQVRSLIEPLYNIAEVKVLFNRYPEIANYQMSCGLARNRRDRWCYTCPMCAKAFLYVKALDFKPLSMEFNKNMFNRESKNYYPLFKKPKRILEKPIAVRDEQLLSFYLAYKNGSRGYLIEKFKEKFLGEAKKREDELYKRFFRVYDAKSLKGKMKQDVCSIFKEEFE
jgi:hypothetical protein